LACLKVIIKEIRREKMKKLVPLLFIIFLVLAACTAEPVEVEVTRVVSEVVEVTRVVTETIEVEGESVEVTRVVTEEIIVEVPADGPEVEPIDAPRRGTLSWELSTSGAKPARQANP
jgi:hypothetical protein